MLWKEQLDDYKEIAKPTVATGVKHRDNIRDKFFDCLKLVGELDDDLDLKDLETRARDVANRLEAAMSKELCSTSKEYAAKSRSLLFNLQDKNNIGLRLKLMAGAVEPNQVIKFSSHELASEAKQIEREELSKANLQARRTDWAQEQAKASDKEGFFKCFKCGSKKTHFY